MIRTLVPALPLLVLAAPAAAQDDPKAYVDAIYRTMASGKAGVAPRFAPELQALIDRHGRIAAEQDDPSLVTPDPFCFCQEAVGGSFQSSARRLGSTRATVTVSWRNGPQAETVRIDLERDAVGWMVTDTHMTDLPSFAASLREDIAAFAPKP
jgi:hypothetical protein